MYNCVLICKYSYESGYSRKVSEDQKADLILEGKSAEEVENFCAEESIWKKKNPNDYCGVPAHLSDDKGTRGMFLTSSTTTTPVLSLANASSASSETSCIDEYYTNLRINFIYKSHAYLQENIFSKD